MSKPFIETFLGSMTEAEQDEIRKRMELLLVKAGLCEPDIFLTAKQLRKETPTKPLIEMEQMMKDGVISCPYHIGLEVICRDYATCLNCRIAALTQAEGDTP